MPIRIFPDKIQIGNFNLFEGNGGVQFDGQARAENFLGNQGFQGSVSGYNAGGLGGTPPFSSQNTIDKFPFATNSNATDVGDLTQTRSLCSGQSSSSHGYSCGGSPVPTVGNSIDKFPFAADTNASDVGDLTSNLIGSVGQSSLSHGYVSTGSNPSVGSVNTIQKFPFAVDTNTTDVGDTTVVGQQGSGQSSFTSGYTTGVWDGPDSPPSLKNTIDKFPFATDTNATDVGDITETGRGQAGQSSTVSGYRTSGYKGTPLNVRLNTIEKFPFATDSNATDIADLTRLTAFSAGQSSTTSGYTCGGEPPAQNNIDKFPFATDNNATDVGDLTQGRYYVVGQQY